MYFQNIGSYRICQLIAGTWIEEATPAELSQKHLAKLLFYPLTFDRFVVLL